MNRRPDLRTVQRFLARLRATNNRDWFQAHRAEFEVARANFEDYVALLLVALTRTESLVGVTPKDCIFRLNRDLRFTRDKTPYKPYMSAYVAPGGRKSRRLGYYVHIEPGNHSMIAGGLHEPEASQIDAWRRAIDRDPIPFLKITRAKPFRTYFGRVDGQKLKTAPRGYPKDHPRLDLLRLKTVTVSRSVSDILVASPQFVKETLVTFKAMRAFLRYLDELT